MDGTSVSARPDAGYTEITVTPWSPTVGAVIGGVDLTQPLTDAQIAEIKRAFIDHLVVFFRDQKIRPADQARFAEYFGDLHIHVGKKTNSRPTEDPRVRILHADRTTPGVSGNYWHTDQSCAPVPPLCSILYLHTVPDNGGGDTGFASMYAAYDALSDRMKAYLDGLTATHEGAHRFGEGTPAASHPIVVRHPDSGRKLIYVNSGFTTRIDGMPKEESDALLTFLYAHCIRPEWTTRFRWEPHSIAMWDNRCSQHRAICDYLPQVRSGYRIQVKGTAAPVAG